jgi:uncharacterized metal-binding protein YceD (DUF177 family)
MRDEDTIAVSGQFQAGLGLVCGRCLEPYRMDVAQKLDLFLLPHREGQERRTRSSCRKETWSSVTIATA